MSVGTEQAAGTDECRTLRSVFAALNGRELELSDLFADDLLATMHLGNRRTDGGKQQVLELLVPQQAAAVASVHNDRIHEVVRAFSRDRVELVLGQIRHGGIVKGSFVAVAGMDDSGRIERYLTGFAPFDLLSPQTGSAG